MLAIAERLAVDRGLTYAFCDTDSMAFCDYHKPSFAPRGATEGKSVMEDKSREEFRSKVQEITDWFQPLNPYKHDIRLFNIEHVNYKLADHETGKTVNELEPLYCLAISAKRYCLFNRSPNDVIDPFGDSVGNLKGAPSK